MVLESETKMKLITKPGREGGHVINGLFPELVIIFFPDITIPKPLLRYGQHSMFSS